MCKVFHCVQTFVTLRSAGQECGGIRNCSCVAPHQTVYLTVNTDMATQHPGMDVCFEHEQPYAQQMQLLSTEIYKRWFKQHFDEEMVSWGSSSVSAWVTSSSPAFPYSSLPPTPLFPNPSPAETGNKRKADKQFAPIVNVKPMFQFKNPAAVNGRQPFPFLRNHCHIREYPTLVCPRTNEQRSFCLNSAFTTCNTCDRAPGTCKSHF